MSEEDSDHEIAGSRTEVMSLERQEQVGLGSLRFDNRFSEELPVDRSGDCRPRQVVGSASSVVLPARASDPKLVAWSSETSDGLGIDPNFWSGHSDEAAQIFSGNILLEGMAPVAARYGGHQFGHWAGQLGDGRAMSLGEVVVDGQRSTLQLKGAGPTPYSRGADGFAVMRSSIREFLCSEAMHHLGIPTTRALSLVSTGDKVRRDMFYDGNAGFEDGAVVCRVAPSFIRFGNFQLYAANGELDGLRSFLNFTIRHYFPEQADQFEPDSNELYEAMFAEVCRSTLEVIVGWMRVGFVHGVMNTDNMSIHGITIDYGPYGWLDDFDPNWTPNTTDSTHRRYRYGNQPQVAHWNLVQLANAIVQLTQNTEPLEEALAAYGDSLDGAHQAMWRSKIGLPDTIGKGRASVALVEDLLGLLTAAETDMTVFFRALAKCDVLDSKVSDEAGRLADAGSMAPLRAAYYNDDEYLAVAPRVMVWRDRYVELLKGEGVTERERSLAMNRVNPCYVLRNYLAQIAIDEAASGDYSEIERLLDALRAPYVASSRFSDLEDKRPEWARDRPGCSTLSCSS